MGPEQQLIAALAGTFTAALSSVAIAWINSRKLNKIHVLVNSNMTRTQKALSDSLERELVLTTLLQTTNERLAHANLETSPNPLQSQPQP